MKQICIFLAGILAIVAAGAGVASAQAGTSPTAHAGRATEVALHRTSLGEILSTGSGVTLYEFTRDRTNSDSCIKISGCSQVWPALQSSGRPTAGTGVRRLAAVRDQAVHGRQSGHLRRSPALSLSRRQRTGRHCLRWSKRVRRILGRARCDRPGGEVDAHAHAISVVLDQRKLTCARSSRSSSSSSPRWRRRSPWPRAGAAPARTRRAPIRLPPLRLQTTSSSSPAGAVVVKTASNAPLGATVLIDAQGMTLYSLSAEQGGKFICTSTACTQVWHPLIASGGTPSGSVGSPDRQASGRRRAGDL